MAQAYKCDRCRKLKEGEKHGQVTIVQEDRDLSYPKTLDLCRDCYIVVDIFITTPS